jgi:peptidoglycan/LPS O-acetylase OafA/YrhL
MGRLSGLDALRGIAALLVLFHHVGTLNGHHWGLAPYYMMVDFFFMLSGYVMARAFEGRMNDGLSTIDFLAMRYRRLWAPMAVGSLVGATVLLLTDGDVALVAAAIVPALLLMPIPTTTSAFPLNAPSWSLYFEILANLAHVLLLRRIATSMLAAVSMVCIAWLVYSRTGMGDDFRYGYLRAFATYPLGIVIWRVFGDFGRWPFWPGAAALILIPAAMYVLDVPLWAQPFALLSFPFVLLCGLGLREDGPFAPIARVMGAISFPLYAVHFPIVKLVAYTGGPEWIAILLSVIGAVAVSFLIDQRVLRRTSRANDKARIAVTRGLWFGHRIEDDVAGRS